MPFTPHTPADIDAMLQTIGVDDLETLFEEIPQDLRAKPLQRIPEGLPEMAVARLMQQRAQQDQITLSFLGAGAYEHHIPAAVWELASRGEFMTAYTPYQAEASQGNLQVIYEFQTMLASLTGMDAANASVYDGATALAEAILMAARIQRKQKTKRVLVPATLHPFYLQTLQTIVSLQGITIITLPYCPTEGIILPTTLQPGEYTALVIPYPNFFGALEQVDELTNWAHQQGAIVIAVANPIALAVLKEPGQWGEQGADIVCGEGQPLGLPLASGGPYFGFLCCKAVHVRQLPGRLVGRTVDRKGNPGFTLTLQAREQHIRRAKATSNICTNQGLAVTAATIYLSLLGPYGLRQVGLTCMQNLRTLLNELTTIPGITQRFTRTVFHEAVIQLPKNSEHILDELAQQQILGGYSIAQHYPELSNCILICATETKTQEDIAHYVECMQRILNS